MSFEIVPKGAQASLSIPADAITTNKSFAGIERYIFSSLDVNGSAVWSDAADGALPSTLYSSPANSTSTTDPTNHLFEIYATAISRGRVYTTGVGRYINNTWAVNKVSWAENGTLRSSNTQVNAMFTKCTGSFPTAIRPESITCSEDGARIIVYGSSLLMASENYGDSWYSLALPSGVYFSSSGTSLECDGTYFYLLDDSGVYRISASFSSSSTSASWTKLYTRPLSDITVSGFANLRVFTLDTRNTQKMYVFSFSNSSACGVVFSRDCVTWYVYKFGSAFTISDIAFNNKLGNKLVLTGNVYLGNNLNSRYVAYTSDLTTGGSWSLTTSSVFNSADYYNLRSICVTKDNKYVVFDRLGSYYHTTDLVNWTKVSMTGPQVYDHRVYLIDSSEYAIKGYGNSALDEATADGWTFSQNYGEDSFRGTDSYAARKWTKLNLSFTSVDDGYSNEMIDIGFNWGYNGSTYSNFRLNTNGQVQFSNFDGSIGVQSGDKIAASSGDLWLSPGASIGSDPGITTITTDTYVTPAVLSSTYGIVVTQSTPGIFVFSLNKSNAGQYCRYIQLGGYNTATTATEFSGGIGGVVDYEGANFYINESLSNILSFKIKMLKSYYAYDKNNLASFNSVVSDFNPHGVWTKNISWIDDGIQHNIFRMVVRGGKYGDTNLDAGYRISLYKAGTSQKISVAALSNYSVIAYAYTSPTLGPYPAASSNSALKAPLDWNETTWYSNDNGANWSLYTKDNSKKSTVTQMGPIQSSTDVSLNTTEAFLLASRTNVFDATDAWDISVKHLYFGYPDEYKIQAGTALRAMLIRYINGERTSADTYENTLFNLFNTTYSVEVDKNTYYYKYADFNRDGVVDITDANLLYSITTNTDPYNPYVSDGLATMLQYMLQNYSNAYMQVAKDRGWVKTGVIFMSQLVNGDHMIPGIKNLSMYQNSNVSMSALRELGPVYRTNIRYGDYYKTSYRTAYSIRYYRK